MSVPTGWKRLPKNDPNVDYWRHEGLGRAIALGKIGKNNTLYAQGYRYFTNIKGRFGDKEFKSRTAAMEHLLKHMRKIGGRR